MDKGIAQRAVSAVQAKEKKPRKKSTISKCTLYSMKPEFASVLEIPEISQMLEENGTHPDEDGFLPAMDFNKVFWSVVKKYDLNSKEGISWEGRDDLPEELSSFLNLKRTSSNPKLEKTQTMVFKEVSTFVTEFCKDPSKKRETIIEKNPEETTSE
jgi:hypothetical protein